MPCFGLPGRTQWRTASRAQHLQLRGQFHFGAKASACGFPINSEWKPAAGILNDSTRRGECAGGYARHEAQCAAPTALAPEAAPCYHSPRAKSQEPRAKSQEPRARRVAGRIEIRGLLKRIRSVGAGLLAKTVCQMLLFRLARRVRQQAGSYSGRGVYPLTPWRRVERSVTNASGYSLNGQPIIFLALGVAYVRTFEVFRPRRTSDSASATAAVTPSTTGTPARSRIC
jgi:hypothetical protein